MTTYEKPFAAFTLSLVGLILQAVGAIYAASMMVYGVSYWGSSHTWGSGIMMGPWMMMGSPWMTGLWWSPFSAILTVLVIALGVLGVLWMNTAELNRIRAGATLVLIASILAFPTMFGFMIGSLLMLIGSLLGLTWQPTVRR